MRFRSALAPSNRALGLGAAAPEGQSRSEGLSRVNCDEPVFVDWPSAPERGCLGRLAEQQPPSSITFAMAARS